MKAYKDYTRKELQNELEDLRRQYSVFAARGMRLDLSRGKPGGELLDQNRALLETPLTPQDYLLSDGTDLRNYGGADGLPAMKDFFSGLLGIPREYVSIGGNSSLQLMYDALCRAVLYGNVDSPRPWSQEPGRKWLCVVPGYDRHFKITETLGFELISVPITPQGPDMDIVESAVQDPAVKGIWCVPKYSNPTGDTYSDETVYRLARMQCAATDFRIFWDNAYAVHDFGEEGDRLLDIFRAAEECGHTDRVYYFTSTSKITFPGGGVSMFAASPRNLAHEWRYLQIQTIGYDKLNQARHLKYLRDPETARAHMRELGAVIRGKFDIAEEILASMEGLEIASWTRPRGGYFISLDVPDGCASRVYCLMRDAGVTLTPPGATYPYGHDPRDRNLRLAPTYPSEGDLRLACAALTMCVRIAACEKLLGLPADASDR